MQLGPGLSLKKTAEKYINTKWHLTSLRTKNITFTFRLGRLLCVTVKSPPSIWTFLSGQLIPVLVGRLVVDPLGRFNFSLYADVVRWNRRETLSSSKSCIAKPYQRAEMARLYPWEREKFFNSRVTSSQNFFLSSHSLPITPSFQPCFFSLSPSLSLSLFIPSLFPLPSLYPSLFLLSFPFLLTIPHYSFSFLPSLISIPHHSFFLPPSLCLSLTIPSPLPLPYLY